MSNEPILIGNYLGSGACGSAFLIEGDDQKVIKIARLVDYKYGAGEKLEISYLGDAQRNFPADGWTGGIALNEFQAILFEKLAEMTLEGEPYTSTLPKTYSFTSGEITQDLLDDITASFQKYKWDRSKYNEFMNSFTVENGFFPGTRIGMWVIERVGKIGQRIDGKPYEELNKWCLEHNMVVRDTKNTGNYGFRADGSVCWFDPGVSPWPIKKEWKNSPNNQLKNLYVGFKLAFGESKIDDYENQIDRGDYIRNWHQAEEREDIVQFVAESEAIIGDYIDAGAAGSVYALNKDKVLKIVRLNHKFHGQDINKNQADFIEDIFIDKLEGEPINSRWVDIYHYNEGTATEDLVKIVNEKAKKAHSKLKEGEPIALWIMERLPTVGDLDGSDDWRLERREGMDDVKSWAKSKGYIMHDLHDGNYGARKDGSFVVFDGWPIKFRV